MNNRRVPKFIERRRRPRKVNYWPSVKIGSIVILVIALIGALSDPKEIKTFKLVSPVPKVQAKQLDILTLPFTPVPTPTSVPTPLPTPSLDVPPSRQVIADEVKRVFGADAPKAFLLLSHENSSLNPSAVNTAGNTPKGSRDIGVFQINEFWQQVQGRYLFNYKINILIAKQIYDESNHTFKMWTAGRALNI